MYLEVLVIANILIIYYFAITQKYSKIVFEYESLAIFAGNAQKCPHPPIYIYDVAVLLHIKSRCRLDHRNSLHRLLFICYLR